MTNTEMTLAAPAADSRVLAFLDQDLEAIGYMTPPAMQELLFISNFEKSDPDSPAPDNHGYQREPISSRILPIARFYLGAELIAKPTPLILSVRLTEPGDISDFVSLFNEQAYDEIKRRYSEAVVSVVDGQHRFLGLVKAHELDPQFCPRVPVLLVFGMTFADEAEFFDIINSTQKKLPKALIEITKADVTAEGEMSYSQRIRLIATMLARHEKSVWRHQVNLTGARDPNKPVTFEGLRRSSASMFTKELLERLEARGLDVDKVARDYWSVVSEACPDAWNGTPDLGIDDQGNEVEITKHYRLKELVGVASVAKLGRDILASALEHDNFDQKMAALTTKLSHVDWEKRAENPWMRSQAGFAGQSDLYTMLHRWVYLNEQPA